MRAATYTVPPAAGDKESGECAVFYFGAGQGGGVHANIDRWVGQFRGSDGKPLAKAGKTAKQTINGLGVTTVEVSGAYAAGAGPMMQPTTPKPGYRLLGAIVEGPQGNVFFKFTGPVKTVEAARADFQKLLQSVKK